MCGRFTLEHSPQLIAEVMGYASADERAETFPARYNISPTQPIVSVRREGEHKVMRLLRWGLVPGWVKDPQDFTLLINARKETVLQKPSFRGSVRHHRCLIPASGYYEWERSGSVKQPYYIRPKSGEPFAFAGLWAEWSGPDGNLIDSGAIMTEPANKTLGRIHHRMPVLVRPEHYDDWLNTGEFDSKPALAMLEPVQEDFFEAFPVDTSVNSARNEGPDLIKPIQLAAKPLQDDDKADDQQGSLF